MRGKYPHLPYKSWKYNSWQSKGLKKNRRVSNCGINTTIPTQLALTGSTVFTVITYNTTIHSFLYLTKDIQGSQGTFP